MILMIVLYFYKTYKINTKRNTLLNVNKKLLKKEKLGCIKNDNDIKKQLSKYISRYQESDNPHNGIYAQPLIN